MADIGTVTIQVTPVIPEDLQEQVEAQVREAVADVLRRVADGLTAKPTSAAANQPRYYAVVRQGVAGILDREMPHEWAPYDDEDDFDIAAEGAADLNRGDERGFWEWEPLSRD